MQWDCMVQVSVNHFWDLFVLKKDCNSLEMVIANGKTPLGTCIVAGCVVHESAY